MSRPLVGVSAAWSGRPVAIDQTVHKRGYRLVAEVLPGKRGLTRVS